MKEHETYDNHYNLLNSMDLPQKWKYVHISIRKNDRQNDFLTSLPCKVIEKLLKINSNIIHNIFQTNGD